MFAYGNLHSFSKIRLTPIMDQVKYGLLCWSYIVLPISPFICCQ